jgi:tetratricopeptide (TPR) repeat protein
MLITLPVLLLFLPVVSQASEDAARPTGLGYVVSVRELSIRSRARDAFQNGARLLAKNDPSGSLAQFHHAIAEFPSYYEAYYLIGVADLRLGRQGEAEQAFRKSIELSVGRFAEAQFGLGAILCDQGKFAEAEPTIRKGLEIDDHWIGHYYLARALFGLNRWDEAEKSVGEVVIRKADLPEAYLLLADIHIRQKNYSALLKDVDDYVRLDPDSATSVQARTVQENARRLLSQSNSAATPMQTGH